jgi:hypothetical protein
MSDSEQSLIPGPPPRSEGRRKAGEQSSDHPLPSETGEGVEGRLWPKALPAIADRLQEIGYDIVTSQSSTPLGGSIVARRDLGDRAVVLAIDSGGRFRAEITWVVGEWPSQDEIAGVAVQVVDAVSRAVTVTGQLSGPEHVIEVVTGLGTVVSWADVAESEAPPPSAQRLIQDKSQTPS